MRLITSILEPKRKATSLHDVAIDNVKENAENAIFDECARSILCQNKQTNVKLLHMAFFLGKIRKFSTSKVFYSQFFIFIRRYLFSILLKNAVSPSRFDLSVGIRKIFR